MNLGGNSKLTYSFGDFIPHSGAFISIIEVPGNQFQPSEKLLCISKINVFHTSLFRNWDQKKVKHNIFLSFVTLEISKYSISVSIIVFHLSVTICVHLFFKCNNATVSHRFRMDLIFSFYCLKSNCLVVVNDEWGEISFYYVFFSKPKVSFSTTCIFHKSFLKISNGSTLMV